MRRLIGSAGFHRGEGRSGSRLLINPVLGDNCIHRGGFPASTERPWLNFPKTGEQLIRLAGCLVANSSHDVVAYDNMTV